MVDRGILEPYIHLMVKIFSCQIQEGVPMCLRTSSVICVHPIPLLEALMATQTINSSHLRLPAFLLVITPLPFIGVFASGILGFAGKVITTFDKITPDVMATIRLPWIVIFSSLFVAYLLGIAGLSILANSLKDTSARPLAWLTIIGALAGLAILVFNTYLRFTMVNFTEPTLGQTTQWQIASTLVYLAHLVNSATILAASVSLFVSGWLRRTGLVVGVLSGLLFIVGLVPSISYSTPPFVLVFFWLALGIGLFRRRTA